MKHLEESNKEVKEEELESEREAELQITGNNKSVRPSPPNPLTLTIDRCSSGSSPCRSTEGELVENGRGGSMVDDTPRDSMNIKDEPPSSPEPHLQVNINFYCFFFSHQADILTIESLRSVRITVEVYLNIWSCSDFSSQSWLYHELVKRCSDRFKVD